MKRLRLWGRTPLLTAALALGCGDDAQRERDVVARVVGEGQDLALERAVVEMIMERDGLDEAQAKARAIETLRLVAARRAEIAARERPPTHEDELDPARREQLVRAAMVRLWLDEVFEPAHEAEDIPQRVVEQNLADPSVRRRLFHPELYFVCQALVVPAEVVDGRNVEPPTEPEAAQRWRAAAEQAFAPFVARVQRLAPDLLASDDCSLLGKLVGGSERSFETEAGAMTMRFEQFAFAPSEVDSMDPEWLATVTAPSQTERRIIGPFPTRFGLHVVVVGNVEPAQLPDGSLPAKELAAAREQLLRREIEEVWRADQLQRTLAEVRDRRVVRLSPELERER
jgi:hypothetical protein